MFGLKAASNAVYIDKNIIVLLSTLHHLELNHSGFFLSTYEGLLPNLLWVLTNIYNIKTQRVDSNFEIRV